MILEDIVVKKNLMEKKNMLQRKIEETAQRQPNSVALVFHDKEITYQELNERSNVLAFKFKKAGIRKGDIAAIFVERSFSMIEIILGIWKAGASYLPIDIEIPEQRVQYMLNDSSAKTIIVTENSDAIFQKYQMSKQLVIVNVDQIEDSHETIDFCIKGEEDTAYVIYTSGTSGKPKGVVVSHGNLSNYVVAMEKIFPHFHERKILNITTISFDIFVMETIFPLTQGMTVVIADDTEKKEPEMLANLIETQKIDVIQTTPSRLEILLRNEEFRQKISRLSDILCGGETLPKALIKRLKSYTEAFVYNMYGPTEATIWISVKKIEEPDIVTIGKPIINNTFYIFDAQGNQLEEGKTGELCISGKNVAKGYLNLPEQTAEKFLIDPFDGESRMYRTGDLARLLKNGEIELIGRMDDQVKINGYRIELEEIEFNLGKLAEIVECKVVAKDSRNGTKYLVGYYVAEQVLNERYIEEYLLTKMPDYMVPRVYVKLKSFPLSLSGKVNVSLLPDPSEVKIEEKEEHAVELKEIKEALLEIWQEILDNQDITEQINFFAAGGNSLTIVMLISKINKLYPGSVDYADIFSHPSISMLARLIMDSEHIQQKFVVCTVALKKKYLANREEALKDIVLEAELEEGKAEVFETELMKDGYQKEEGLLSAFLLLMYQIAEDSVLGLTLVWKTPDQMEPFKINIEQIEEFSELIDSVKNTLTINTGKEKKSFYQENCEFIRGEMEIATLFSYNGKIHDRVKEQMDWICDVTSYNGKIKIVFEYNPEKLSGEKMMCLFRAYLNLLDSIVE